MQILSLRLRNFRNYRQLDIEFNPHINILVGNNAQGKTNILEAVYLLATARSFRVAKDSEIIKHNEVASYISGKIRRDAVHELEITFRDLAAKKMKYNKKETQPKEFVGNFNVVLFCPEDLYLIKGSPAGRRRFLDLEISQVNATYRSLLLDYQKILTHRNSQLKMAASKRQSKELLEIWDDQLITTGSRVIMHRAEMIYRLGLLSRLVHRRLSNNLEELALRYKPFYAFDNHIEQLKYDYQTIAKEFALALAREKSNELLRGYSLVGPQRDDFLFLINQLDAKVYGSQGQQRTAALACRLAELEYMKSETGKYPVILLDDVMSELDESRKEYLLNLLQKNVQTIITTTNISDFKPEILDNASVFFVESGQITERR